MGIDHIDGAHGSDSPSLNQNNRELTLNQGQHGSRQVFQVMPRQLFQRLTSAEKDIIRQAERLARRERRRAERSNNAKSVESIIAPAEDRAQVNNFNDPYTVVLELAKLADGMNASQNPKVVVMLNETIALLLQQIRKQEEQRHERIREEQEQEQDLQDQKIYEEQSRKEEAIRERTLKRIAKENRLRQGQLRNR